MPVLEVEGLHVFYGSIHAIKGISFKVEQGQIVTLIGANGAGKTTTLSTIAGLVKSRRGRIIFNGKEVQNQPPHQINRMGVCLVPEGRRIFPNLTVMENLMMGAFNRKDKDGIKQDLEWVFTLFPRLAERKNQLGGTLSGGEQQMLAISRALMSRPKVLMMDEPSLGLAPILVEEVFEIIKKLNSEGMTILLVEQNAVGALNISHYGYVLETGNIVLEGPAKDLLKDEQVKKAYLGL
ncbi:amino acid/amide ABC transporter ATP-binding protein 2, HAAT family [Fervidobacterium changbaicum]|uniref:ABC transporter ATP-binding protein n=2 Tax=Fervidobacterium TaxID=2422 RepID=A0AAI8CMC0_FERIS|nr:MULTISPECIES: ABC transporter ATP-binding protein [Fervidobacterium]AMW33107.1 ABC transporter ATP-binding protein [Fervidobacterium islandicum]QAV33149.1 ABC transporter ATP-binding protein [Fervidobacterium changbaicum]SDH11729.1 amino acid/amide ABC transporter ATP-binding protein 2, HAAT family [Fervidobacterium changbaicum]